MHNGGDNQYGDYETKAAAMTFSILSGRVSLGRMILLIKFERNLNLGA